MTIVTETLGRVTTIRPSGPYVTLRTGVEELREALSELVSSQRCHLVLDLADVEHVDSSFIGLVLGLLRRIPVDGGELALAGVNESIAELFRLTGVDREFRSFPTADIAVSALR